MTSHVRHRRFDDATMPFPVPIEPGEIAINTANRQVAAGDAATASPGVPLPLIAIRFWDERAQYAEGDFVVKDELIWMAEGPISPGAFEPDDWMEYPDATLFEDYADEGDALRVAKAGDTMTGPLMLYGAPVDGLEAATKAYVDAQVLPVASFATDAEVAAGVVNNRSVTPDTLRNEMAREFSIPEASFNVPVAIQTGAGAPSANKLVKTNGLGVVDATMLPVVPPPTASSVPFAPAGNIDAMTVQAAIVELDAEKAALVHGHIITDVTGLQTSLDAKAPLASPAFSGAPTTPNIALAADSTQVANTAFVQQEFRTRQFNHQTGTTYTFVVSDAGKVCLFNSAAPVTVAIPPNSSVALPVGTQIDVVQYGAGQVTFAPGGGVTIASEDGKKKLAKQFSGGLLLKISADGWLLIGNLAV